MRAFLFFFIILVMLHSCNNSGTKEKGILEIEIENPETHLNGAHQGKDTFSLYLDTLSQIEKSSFKSDTFSFSQFYDTQNGYHLIYHETGKMEKAGEQYGLSVFSINDTTIGLKLLKKKSLRWTTCDSLNLYDIRFSPAMFYPRYADFNQNGTNDILLVFYQTMGLADSHGYLLLFTKETEKLSLIENSLDIPNLEVWEHKINSITQNHPGSEPRDYIQTDEYKIFDNQLMLQNSERSYK